MVASNRMLHKSNVLTFPKHRVISAIINVMVGSNVPIFLRKTATRWSLACIRPLIDNCSQYLPSVAKFPTEV